jgi:hypothetical protein
MSDLHHPIPAIIPHNVKCFIPCLKTKQSYWTLTPQQFNWLDSGVPNLARKKGVKNIFNPQIFLLKIAF